MKQKRILAMGDFHSGHVLGLTPPKYYQSDTYPFSQHQRALWQFYTKTLNSIGEVDVIIINGDMIDGNGYRSGGSEQIFTSEIKQTEIATEVVRYTMQKLKCNKVFMTYGTAYHTGTCNDFEDIIASNVGATIDDQLFLEIGGQTFDVKHHTTGGRGTPGNYGSHAAKKESVVNSVVSLLGHEPKADITIRSHVHIYRCDKDAHGAVMTLPCLQWAGTKYGARRCFGHVDMGVMLMEVTKDNFIDIPILAKLDLQKKQLRIVK